MRVSPVWLSGDKSSYPFIPVWECARPLFRRVGLSGWCRLPRSVHNLPGNPSLCKELGALWIHDVMGYQQVIERVKGKVDKTVIARGTEHEHVH
jgi:hypothetical protein